MTVKSVIIVLSIMVLLSLSIKAQNHPEVTNVTFSISGTEVTVSYDVADAGHFYLTISMEVSDNGGTTYNYNFNSPEVAHGDIGNISRGTGKKIYWTYNGGYNSNFKVKIIADDKAGDQIYYAGQIYNTVTIGTQIWLKENMNAGTKINGIYDQTNNSTLEKYCYDDLESNCATYGGFYQWGEAMQYVTTEGAKGICPTGWHIATMNDFATLSTSVGNSGNALKAVGQGTGTNTSGFSALLSGYRYINGTTINITSYTYFWSSKEYINNDKAYYVKLQKSSDVIYLDGNDQKIYGFSVRCLKN